METRLWTIPAAEQTDRKYLICHPAIVEAAARLKDGELIAFPTETVYGLGADATNDAAVEAIFRAKGRPSDNPLIVHIGDRSHVANLARDIPPAAETAMDVFWPGPLTLILPSAHTVSPMATAGLDSVAIRLPSHPLAQALLMAADRPVVAPSANRSGRPSPTNARHVLDDLGGQIYGVLDGGVTSFGLESTVIDMTGEVPMVLRPGGVTVEQLQEVFSDIIIDAGESHDRGTPRSPGMKYRHYAPRATMKLISGTEDEMVSRIRSLVRQYRADGRKVGVLTTEEHIDDYDADVVIACGRRDNLFTVARELYRSLRQFDDTDIDVIIAETFPRSGWGEPIMNRLLKASSS